MLLDNWNRLLATPSSLSDGAVSPHPTQFNFNGDLWTVYAPIYQTATVTALDFRRVAPTCPLISQWAVRTLVEKIKPVYRPRRFQLKQTLAAACLLSIIYSLRVSDALSSRRLVLGLLGDM